MSSLEWTNDILTLSQAKRIFDRLCNETIFEKLLRRQEALGVISRVSGRRFTQAGSTVRIRRPPKWQSVEHQDT